MLKWMLSAREKASRVHFAAFWWCAKSLTWLKPSAASFPTNNTFALSSSTTELLTLYYSWLTNSACNKTARRGGKKACASLNDAMTNSLEARCYLPDAWQCTDAACFSLPLFSFALFLAHFLHWWIRGVTWELVKHMDSLCICILQLTYCMILL